VCNATKLHEPAYYALKEAHPTLVRDLTHQARVKAAEALRSVFALHKQGRKVRLPQSSTCPLRYNLHTYHVDWQNQTVWMSLLGGRQTIRFRVPHSAAKYVGHPTDTADLIEKDREQCVDKGGRVMVTATPGQRLCAAHSLASAYLAANLSR
jgi:hypothetical protein